jgi:hypothetical protein
MTARDRQATLICRYDATPELTDDMKADEVAFVLESCRIPRNRKAAIKIDDGVRRYLLRLLSERR